MCKLSDIGRVGARPAVPYRVYYYDIFDQQNVFIRKMYANLPPTMLRAPLRNFRVLRDAAYECKLRFICFNCVSANAALRMDEHTVARFVADKLLKTL